MERKINAPLVWAAVAVAVLLLASAPPAHGQSAENVAIVINDQSADSRAIGEAYARLRSIPSSNVLRIRTATEETIDRTTFAETIERPLAAAIGREHLHDRILYLVLTKGVPLRIAGTGGRNGTSASVDSELTLLYRRMTGQPVSPGGPVANPYFLGDQAISHARPFTHDPFDIFLVSRLDAYTADEAVSVIQRATAASGPDAGRVVFDYRDALIDDTSERWLDLAAARLADQGFQRVTVVEQTPAAARRVTDVLGYLSWGSADPENRVRTYGMTFAPCAIAATFVGSDARTFREPPAPWAPSGDAANRSNWYAGSPESLAGDLIRDGVTGVAGYIAQPFLDGTVRPQILFPAYFTGFNLVEAFYLAMPYLSWQTVIVGDPLCRPFPRNILSASDIEGGRDSVTQLPVLFSKRRVAVALAQSRGIPEPAIAIYVRAEMLTARGDAAGARDAIDEAIKLAPRFVSALLHRAALDESDRRHDEALDTYRRILEVDANQIVALNNLAYGLAVHRNMPTEALALAERAVAGAPDNPTVLDTLSWVLHLLGDHARAAQVMTRALRTEVRNPQIRLHAAVVFAASGNRARAERELLAAVALNPVLADSAEVRSLQTQFSN